MCTLKIFVLDSFLLLVKKYFDYGSYDPKLSNYKVYNHKLARIKRNGWDTSENR
jgi:hypothetical protein